MNPLLPLNVCVPDVEAREMPDGRLYLYGSWDIPGSPAYCSREYHVFSSADMETWTDHGVSFSADWLGIDDYLYAPDCIYHQGRYWLYYCTSGAGEGVAVADSPAGPFEPYGKIAGADGDSIDPAVFVDDDGQAYYFWGQFQLRGAKLADDMTTLLPSTLCTEILTEWEHGFHEGASLRKRGDIYYLVYTDISRGRATCMSYAWAKSPLGPYTKGGVIVDNTGCDPVSWNNHGSIAPYKGKWYVFYHRSSGGSITSRRVAAEPITFDADGRIAEVPMTSQGAGRIADGRFLIPASFACRMRTPFAGEAAGVRLAQEQGEEILAQMKSGDWVEFRSVRIHSEVRRIHVLARVRKGGSLRFLLEESRLLARIELSADGEWQEYGADLLPEEGCMRDHILWIYGDGQGLDCDIREFRFL